MGKKIAYVSIIFSLYAALSTHAAEEKAVLNPKNLKNAISEHISIPRELPGISSDLFRLPAAPNEALKHFSPQLQEINKDVRDKTGVDVAKFLGWITGAFKWLFGIITGILESTSDALDPQ